MGKSWRLWADTGGTFTDCLAIDPTGRQRRAKVLSSSALRGRVASRPGITTLVVEGSWSERGLAGGAPLPDGFFRGYRFRRLGGDRSVGIVGSAGRSETLELEDDPGDLAPGAGCELLSPEEAPVLGARLMLGARLDEALPPIAARLATTRGTNALLERRGAPTVLFLTRGFADLLRIGTQERPDLFALDIRRPEPLYAAVVEVDERLAADGTVLRPLDTTALYEAARRAVGRGLDTAAIALLHAYLDPTHEEQAEEELRRAGFVHVSRSAATSPLIKLLPRAQTALVDAYLTETIGGYVEAVGASLGRPETGEAAAGSTLHLMTSAGGLAAASEFRARDSLLSGPAGGVVGAAAAGRRAGYGSAIAFDMGGTSTDVARFDGDYEYLFEHRVGDALLAAPALAIESVAAGGGSICSFDGYRLRVGPESAGAAPGPACYGAGGPLTLTDVHLLLGRLLAERFGIPIDRAASRRALDSLVRSLGEGAADEARLLAGLLEIADERMAGAIRSISVARGYDPADYALVSFGGAGGLHACSIASRLGIGRVVVPVDAGLLSAVGLGRAVVERFAQRQVLAPLDEVAGELGARLDELASEARAALASEGVAAGEIDVRRRIVESRFAGQETTVAVEWIPERWSGDPLTGFLDAFDRAYLRLYGYRPEGRAIEIVSLRVVASSRGEPDPALPEPRERGIVEARSRQRAFVGSGWGEVAVHERTDLVPGDRLVGPALFVEAHATTWIVGGWHGRVLADGALLLETG